MTRCVSLNDVAMAYSATTVFPADVWADTRTDWEFSMHRRASRWKGSSTKGNSLTGVEESGLRRLYSTSGGTATWNVVFNTQKLVNKISVGTTNTRASPEMF